MEFDEFIRHFNVKQRKPGQVQALCPAHDDKQASLTISRGADKILLSCHAGCKYEDVLAAVGLSARDMFFEQRQPQEEKWRQYVEGREGQKIAAVYSYHDINTGDYCFSRVRLEGKRFVYGVLKDGRFTYGLNGRKRKDFAAVYGDISAIKTAIANGRTVYIAEGEKDVDALAKHGCIACTYGGSQDWQGSLAELFKGADVVVCADNDKAGMNVAQQICSDLNGLAKAVKMIVPTPDIPKGDISDFLKNHSTEDFERLIREAGTAEPEQRDFNRNLISSNRQISTSSLVKTLKRLDAVNTFPTNDLGSARLFSAVFKDECRYSPSVRDWQRYDGTKWSRDNEGMAARNNCKKLSDAVLKYAAGLDDMDDNLKTAYHKYAASLTSCKIRNTIVNDSRDVNCFTNEQLDADDYLLNVRNGTLDLSDTEPVFRPHNPDDLISKCCNADYDPDAVCGLWERTVDQIMEGDADKTAYLKKLFGLSLTGDTTREEFYFCYGASTRNGKTTVLETIQDIMGDYATTLNPESLAAKPNRDSRTASPDIAKLAGVRLVIAPEPPRGMLFDASLCKSLTGGDTITARFLKQNEFSFVPKFKLIFGSNYLPKINDQTVFTSGRVKVIEFTRHFSDEEQDKTLKKKLKKESAGILNWMLQGLALYRQEGLLPPESVLAATQDYADNSDKFGCFVSECLVESKKNISAGAAYERFADWCKDGGFGTESKSSFFEELRRRKMLKDSGTIAGKTVRRIIPGYSFAAAAGENSDGFRQLDDGEKTPFEEP